MKLNEKLYIVQRALVLFGKQLRALRKERNLSQEKLAELCHVHRNYPGRVERGEVNLRFDHIMMLAHGLSIKPQELFQLIPIPKVNPQRFRATARSRDANDRRSTKS